MQRYGKLIHGAVWVLSVITLCVLICITPDDGSGRNVTGYVYGLLLAVFGGFMTFTYHMSRD